MSETPAKLEKPTARIMAFRLLGLIALALVFSGQPWTNETIIAPINRFTGMIFTGIARLWGCDLRNFELNEMGTLFGTSINARIGYGCDGLKTFISFELLISAILLAAATGRSWKYRGKASGLAAAILAIMLIVELPIYTLVMFEARAGHSFRLGELTRFLYNLILSLNFFVLPLAMTIAAGWLTRHRGTQAEPASRKQACRCGSGNKYKRCCR